jgi:hypothetical protein
MPESENKEGQSENIKYGYAVLQNISRATQYISEPIYISGNLEKAKEFYENFPSYNNEAWKLSDKMLVKFKFDEFIEEGMINEECIMRHNYNNETGEWTVAEN